MVGRDQMLTGIDALSDLCGLPRSTVRRTLQAMTRRGLITQRITDTGRLITIIGLGVSHSERVDVQREGPPMPTSPAYPPEDVSDTPELSGARLNVYDGSGPQSPQVMDQSAAPSPHGNGTELCSVTTSTDTTYTQGVSDSAPSSAVFGTSDGPQTDEKADLENKILLLEEEIEGMKGNLPPTPHDIEEADEDHESNFLSDARVTYAERLSDLYDLREYYDKRFGPVPSNTRPATTGSECDLWN